LTVKHKALSWWALVFTLHLKEKNMFQDTINTVRPPNETREVKEVKPSFPTDAKLKKKRGDDNFPTADAGYTV
jgi:hypothetical protein